MGAGAPSEYHGAVTTLMVAVRGGLLRARGASRWQEDVLLEGLRLQCLALAPGRPERVYAGTEDEGLWLSRDAGASWQPAGEGIHQANVTAVAVSGAEAGVVYAGTEPTALFRSEDGGRSWRELEGLAGLPSADSWSFPPKPWTHHVRAIAADPTRAGAVFVAVEAGALVRSFDGGESWLDRVPGGPYDSHTLALHPRAPGRVWAAAGDGYLESPDHGETWERPEEGLEHGYVWGLALDCADPQTVIVSAASGAGTAHSLTRAISYVYRRSGGGGWRRVREGLPPPEGTSRSVLAAHPAQGGVFYGANNHGLFTSADGGLRWERLPIPWPEPFQQTVNGLVVAAES